jgi:hypothetical protein
MAGYFDMLTKLKRYPQAGPCVFIAPSGYEEFVADAQETFRKVLKFVSGQLTKAARCSRDYDYLFHGIPPFDCSRFAEGLASQCA